MKYFHSWSGGKDSTAAIILDHMHGLPPSTVVFCEVMYDRKHGISGELPEHIDFVKNVAIPKFQEWGFTVDVIHSETDYLDNFFHVISKSRNGNNGKMRGFPLSGRCTINRDCKLKPIHDYYKRASLKPSEYTQYVGIAIDEPDRLERLRGTNKVSLLEVYTMSKRLSTLPVGAVVKSVNTKYNGAVIRFKVGRQSSDRVGLVTERIISLKCFDAMEPNSGNSDRRRYGNNRAAVANLLQWLNSAAGPGGWYSAQHSTDAPPDNANVWSNYNEYQAEAGFLSFFEADFRNALLNDTITVAKSSTDGGGSEQITRKVRLLTITEVGLGNENGIAEGTKWPLFTDNNSRLAYPTAEAVSKSEYTNSGLNASSPWWWWLLTPNAGGAYGVRFVYSDGGLNWGAAYYGNNGVRPALFLAPDTLVSDTTDTDGAYILQWNQPPTTPSSISHGTPRAGQALTVTTGGSTDPEGNTISYVWERRVDSGAYTQIGITSAKSITDTVPSSGTNYQVRVKAVDANGAESAYRTGNATAISYNTNPVISGSDQNVGAKTAPFSHQYTVTDGEAASQTLTVTETVTNGSETITLRTYTATSGHQNTADLSGVWLRLLSGTHVLKIYVTDGAGGSATRQITFSRTVNRIAASRAISTDAKVTKVFLSLYPADHPADATLHVEVTNNPFDTAPVWEDVTSKVGKFVHTFKNTTVA